MNENPSPPSPCVTAADRRAPYSSDQRRAIDPAAHAWVTASAGTGKTHVLTGRVLRLMLAGTPPDRILCLTYTRAAAAEMTNRLLATLARWARLDEAALDVALAGLLDRPPAADERQRARALFLEVLDLPEGLHIHTLHAFCQSLLSRFPLEAGLAPHFKVMEEGEAAELFGDALARITARAARERPLEDAFARLAGDFDDQRIHELLHALLKDRGKLLDGLEEYGGIEGCAAAVRRHLGLSPRKVGENARARLLEAFFSPPDFDKERLSLLVETGARAGKREGSQFAAGLREFLPAPRGDLVAAFTRYRKIFLTDKESEPRKFRSKALKEDPEFAGAFMEEAERVKEASRQLCLLNAAEVTEALLRIGGPLVMEYERLKRDRGALDFDDLIARAIALLSDEARALWVLYKLDAGIDHVLIDEAQDSNPDQWALIRKLTTEYFAGHGRREDGHGTVFAVGDIKQSIFRFQGAEPDSFLTARDDFEQCAKDAGHDFHKIPLDTSFRSGEAVLRLVDAVFSCGEAQDWLKLEGRTLHHKAHRSGVPGLVELWPLEKVPVEKQADEAADDDIPEAWRPAEVHTGRSDPESRLAVRIAERIRRMLDEGERLESEGRAIRPGDIMVLVRRRSRFVDRLLRALREARIPVAGRDRLVVDEHLAVKDLLAAMRFALLPEDDLNLAILLKSPLIGLDEETLIALAAGREPSRETLWSRLVAAAQKKEDGIEGLAHARLAGWLERADFVPPYEFLADILFREGGLRRLAERLGEEVTDPIEELLDLAVTYERTQAPGLQGFLAWLEHHRLEVKRDLEAGRDEVRIMTIHGAKGLEAPIVFLPDTAQVPQEQRGRLIYWMENTRPTNRPSPCSHLPVAAPRSKADIHEPLDRYETKRLAAEEAEYWRLLYVALTRARDRLYIAGWETKRNAKAQTWYKRIAAAFDELEPVEEIPLDGGQMIRRHRCGEMAATAGTDSLPQAVAPSPVALPDWIDRPPPEEKTSRRPIAPSHLEEEGERDGAPPISPAADDAERRYLRGRLLHELLEHLPDLPPEERRNACRRHLENPAFALTESEIAAWTDEVTGILDDPQFAPLFGPASRAEVPVSGRVAGAMVVGRIDRLAILDDRILIVDYKTQRPPPERVEDVPAGYLRQMACYRRLLADRWPDRRIEAALLWTAAPRLMALPAERLE
ncbi:MAG: double-strand break repair helicase AddA, partial [Alphaproteobacteria bacterium]